MRDNLKREGKKIVRLMQEWEQFQIRSTLDETKVDLHQVIRQVAEDASFEKQVITLAPSILADPLVITGSQVDLAHFFRLVLIDALHRTEDHVLPSLHLETETINGKATVRFLWQSPPENMFTHEEPPHTR